MQSASFPSSPSSSSQSISRTTTPTVITTNVPAHNLPYTISKNPSPADFTTMSSSTVHVPSSSSSHLTSLSGGNREITNNIENISSKNSTSGGSGNNNNVRGFCDRFGGVPVMLPFSTNHSASSGFCNLSENNNSISGDDGRGEYSERIPIKEEDPGSDDLDDAREMSDYQRSLSEGRLVDR